MIDRTISHYRIVEKLGAGGMGVVYKAQDLHLDRFVALKVLPADKVSDPERRRRFVQEAKAASALNHPNIVTIYDIDEAEGELFIAMEFVTGKTLTELIGRKGLRLKDALQFAIQIADGLGRAHTAGIVHRDLKPANVMVTDDGRVKLLDFGLAKLAEPSGSSSDDAATMTADVPVTEAGKILGTVAYMSPEQAEGKPVDPRSDIFSFGSVLYEMLTGQRAFAGETSASTMAAILTRDPKPPGEVSGAALPLEVERAVMRCLRKEPQRRIQTMSDLKVLLEDLKEDSESGMLSAARPAAVGVKRKNRPWLAAGVSALLLVAAGAVLAWYLLRMRGAEVSAPAAAIERLTYESGTAIEPAISPDGKLVAYACDAGGSFDIYVRQLGSQQAIRRTQHEAIDRSPSFSPDGSRIAFRSERDGGGVYVMDTLIGPERKIADAGRGPAFSPDGNTVAYVVGSVVRGRMFLVSANGGTPQPFFPDFRIFPFGGGYYLPPLWSPDGGWILFVGSREGDPKSFGWWVAPVGGGDPVRLAAPPRRAGASVQICFAWRGRHIYYADGTAIGGMRVYRVPVSGKPWRIAGEPEVLADPAGMMLGASASEDARLVFALVEPAVNVWAVALQANKGVTSGELQPVTNDSSNKLNLSAAGNGSRIAYSFYAPPNNGTRIRDIAGGQEQELAGSSATLTRDGRMVAYRSRGAFYTSEVGSPAARRICQGCAVPAFFSNPADVLVDYGDTVVRQSVPSAEKVTLMDTKGLELSDIALSPGDRWLAFTLPREDETTGLYLSGIGRQPTRRDTWTEVAKDRNCLSSPAWSPDGTLLYYLSCRDGFKCIWAQRIADGGKPEGEPVAVYHFHKSSDASTTLLGTASISVTPDRLYMLLAQTKSNLWSIKLRE